VAEPKAPSSEPQLSIPALEARGRLVRNLVILGVLLSAGLVFALYRKPETKEEVFRTVQVSRRSIVKTVEAAGRLDVKNRVEVPAPLQGRLLSILVREGDRVKEGQPLAVLDQRASELSLRAAQAQAAAASGSLGESQAQLDAAKDNLARAKNLAEKGFGSSADVTRAQADLERAKAGREAAFGEQRAAGQRVASAQLEKSLGSLLAPAAGLVLRAPARLGAAVAPDQGPLFVIGDAPTEMRIDASVSETDVPFVKPGMPAKVTVIALPGSTFEAKVEHIGIDPNLEGGAALYPIRLIVQNPEGKLLPGMSARVRIEVARSNDVLAVHEAALRFTPDGAEPAEPRTRIWKRTGPEQLDPEPVVAGLSDGMYTEVKPGQNANLHEGEAVAIGYTQVDVGSRGPAVSLGGGKK
jgi:HlyD family secretion protein